ncbi:MAG: iron ABC transporter substrate-binding protein [Acidobacteria bacterium]|nr:iron ABC transporter substrate-binding protein [Acidobacteriota bacterium]
MKRALATLLVLLTVAACGGERPAGTAVDSGEPAQSEQSITVYSGRNEKLIAPLIERFEQESGLDVQVRYGDTAELAATLMEEGDRTPASLFISQDAAALGALSDAGLLLPVPADLLERVPSRFRSPDGDWIGLSGRARSVVYDPARISVEDLPKSLDDLRDPRYRGRFGVAPSNGSFQAHMAVYDVLHGQERLEELLAGMVANEPHRYPKNSTIVEAVMRGEIDFGLVNHYYLWQAKSEDPAASVENFFMPEGEGSSFVNLAGAGMLKRSDAAERLLRHLLSDGSQEYFATETFEYPLVAGVEPSVELLPLAEIRTPDVPMAEVSNRLGETLTLIQRSGLLQ